MSYIESMAANLTKFTIRPTKRELPRLERFVEEVQKRYRGQMATAKILKELMGMRPPRVLDATEIDAFHGEVRETTLKPGEHPEHRHHAGRAKKANGG